MPESLLHAIAVEVAKEIEALKLEGIRRPLGDAIRRIADRRQLHPADVERAVAWVSW